MRYDVEIYLSIKLFNITESKHLKSIRHRIERNCSLLKCDTRKTVTNNHFIVYHFPFFFIHVALTQRGFISKRSIHDNLFFTSSKYYVTFLIHYDSEHPEYAHTQIKIELIFFSASLISSDSFYSCPCTYLSPFNKHFNI